MGKYFGTDGFRGQANVTLKPEHAFFIGRYLGQFYAAEHEADGRRARIVIGKDTRRSSYMLEAALVSGIVTSGADAYLLHVTTTPSVAYVTRVDGFDCGIMISASHNAASDNGIKVIGRSGEKMEDDVLQRIEAVLDDPEGARLARATGDAIGRSVDYVAGRNRYIGYLISLGQYSFRDLRIGLDCANGSAWSIAKAVFDALGATTYVIGAEPNGLNINRGVGSTHIEALQSLVTQQGLDIGFAFDGDADRCLCVDDRGQVVTGDHILYVCAKYLKAQGELTNDTVVATVMSNFGLFHSLRECGISCAKTAVGDRYVYEYMAAHGLALGGEQSGHVIFSKHATTGDGILTGLKLMEVMLASKKPMSELTAPFRFYPQVLRNLRVRDKQSAATDPVVVAAFECACGALGEQGRALLRPSGTEPVLRLMVEAPSDELCCIHADAIEEALRRQGHLL